MCATINLAMRGADFYWRFMGSSSRNDGYQKRVKVSSALYALYANLANAFFFPMICAKSLIFQVGT